MGKIITFSKKAKIANGVIGLKISDCIYRIEDSNNRADWYRKFLGIDNALFFSEDINGGETLIILDKTTTQCDINTKLIFAENGINGTYIVPIYSMDNLKLDTINKMDSLIPKGGSHES